MKYQDLLVSLKPLIESEKHTVSLLANVSAFIYQHIADLNWVGFYLHHEKKLILGPFQGKVACSVIELGKGVCGTALENKETIIVPNVHEYDNHIACDSDSNSEVVIPIILNTAVFGVLDVDSPLINRFDEELVEFLKSVGKLIEEKLNELSKFKK